MFSDRELVDMARKSIQEYLRLYFCGYKNKILEASANKRMSVYLENTDKLIVEEKLNLYNSRFIEWFMTSDLFKGLSEKDIINEIDMIYFSKRENFKDIEGFIRKRFSMPDVRALINKKPVFLFLLKLSMEYNLYFDMRHKYDAFYRSLVKKMCKTEGQMLAIILMLCDVYLYDRDINSMAPYFGIDVDRSLFFNIDIREQLINIIGLEILEPLDIKVDDKFNIAFIGNKDRWKQITDSIEYNNQDRIMVFI